MRLSKLYPASSSVEMLLREKGLRAGARPRGSRGDAAVEQRPILRRPRRSRGGLRSRERRLRLVGGEALGIIGRAQSPRAVSSAFPAAPPWPSPGRSRRAPQAARAPPRVPAFRAKARFPSPIGKGVRGESPGAFIVSGRPSSPALLRDGRGRGLPLCR